MLHYFSYKYRGEKGKKALFYADNEKLEMIWDMYAHDLYTPMSEMIVASASEVGIKLILNEAHQTLYRKNYDAGNYEMSTHDFTDYNEPLLAIEKWIPTKSGSPHFHKDAYEKGSFSPEYKEFSKLLKTAATASIEEGIKLGQRMHFRIIVRLIHITNYSGIN